MEFDLQSFVMNQFVLMFFTVVVGLLLGKILKIGSSGIIFLGLIIGWLVKKYALTIVLDPSTSPKILKVANSLISRSVVDDTFFSMFLILFVAAVGLLAGEKVGVVIKKYGFKFIILGFLITFVSAGTTYLMTKISNKSNAYQLVGVYTGALTSSPGLAAAIETGKSQSKEVIELYEQQDVKGKEKILKMIGDPELKVNNTKKLSEDQKNKFLSNAEANIGIGYAVGYPWGVIIVILAIKLLPKIFKINMEEESRKFNKEMEEKNSSDTRKEITPVIFDLTAFMMVCVVGYFVGTLKIKMGPLGLFSLSSTGGILIIGLVFAHIGKFFGLCFRMDKRILSGIRDIGLAMFIAIVGLRYGYTAINSLSGVGLWLSLIAVVVGTAGMVSGFIVGRYALGINWIMLSGAICGGMTSTPGLGVAIDAIGTDDPAAGYGATYPFALFAMVIFSIILFKLPI